MLVVALALIALAVTAAVVIRDAHPPAARRVVETTDPTPEAAAEPDAIDAPTQAIDMTQLVVSDRPANDDPSLDAPTQSVPMPVAFSGAQAAAILPYAAPAAEPIAEPAAFVPAGKPQPQPDPARLIQTEIVIEDVTRAQKMAMTRLVVGLAVSGAAVGFGVIGVARGIMFLIHALSG